MELYSDVRKIQQIEMNWIEALLTGGVLSQVIGFITKVVMFRLNKKDRVKAILNSTAQIYSALQQIAEHQCKMRIVFKSHNSGKPLSTRTHKFTSILYEDNQKPISNLLDEVQNWRLDGAWSKTLQKLSDSGIISTSVHSMEDGRLKDLLTSEKVKFVTLIHLGDDGKEYYYAIYGSTQSLVCFDDLTRRDIQSASDGITRILKL